MTTEHTQDSWVAINHTEPSRVSCIKTTSGEHVGYGYNLPDAQLAAAAPNLLAALERLVAADFGYGEDEWYAALDAISKARGVEPDHDPPDSRNPYAHPFDDALIGHLRNNPPRNE